MSQNGHSVALPIDVGPTAMVLGEVMLSDGVRFADHEHTTHQIAWASAGVLTVRIVDRQWVLPPTRALWIPAGLAHQTASLRGAAMRGIYIDPTQTRWAEPTLVSVTPLIHHLFDHLTQLTDRESIAARRRAEAVLFDLLTPTDVTTLRLRWPNDERARVVADAVASQPADQRTLAQLADEVGIGERTIARSFRTDTGITFGRWRTHVRIAAALPLLAEGMAVARIAVRVGYSTPSAFVAAFSREVGVPPGSYFR
ncbi:MAG: helix-turn-helix transcriptional regulator [Williamsia sp.]|nr:helix-turn-helix transcriptional regulator [Williamsia sp.]